MAGFLSHLSDKLKAVTENEHVKAMKDGLKNTLSEFHSTLQGKDGKPPSEEAAGTVPQIMETPSDIVVTKAELDDVALACNRLWLLDSQRLVPQQHYRINLQKAKSSWAKGDSASRPLFTWVDDQVLNQRDTFKLFLALLDNYEAETGVAEQRTRVEIQEEREFIDSCMRTGPVQYLVKYLVARRVVDSEENVKELLHSLWFKLYRREAWNDSSGFEHVFVGEIRNETVMGMHSWLQLYNEERKGQLNYMGYIKPKRRATNSLRSGLEDEQLQTIQFEWKGRLKPVSSSFIGTSPEFELALYTLCFMCGQEENKVILGEYHAIIKCHRIGRDRDSMKIGTSYPEEVPLDEDEAATRIQGKFRQGQKQRSIAMEGDGE